MINHVSLNGILCDKENDESIVRNVKVIRSYKHNDGYYEEDIIPCIMWTKNNKNSLFSYKSGTLVALDGRIEIVEGKICVIVDAITFLCSNDSNYQTRGT